MQGIEFHTCTPITPFSFLTLPNCQFRKLQPLKIGACGACHLCFELRYGLDLLFKVAHHVHAHADAEAMASLISRNLVIDVRLSGEAGIRSTKDLEVHPSQPDNFQTGLKLSFPQIVRSKWRSLGFRWKQISVRLSVLQKAPPQFDF
ncbi:MAG: hypothetical protein M3Y57_00690 [Acidobacteriota bacterium]|nr:hypothetical protein [Acidobacteriota bacterium]